MAKKARYAIAPVDFTCAEDFKNVSRLERARKRAMGRSNANEGEMWGIWDNEADDEGGFFIEFVYCGKRFISTTD